MESKEAGRQVIRELMGAEFLAERDKSRNEFTSFMRDYAEGVCFGQVWTRPGIDLKQRCILNIAMLTALNRPAQLKLYIEGALNHGCTVAELREILLQATIYCGLPAALDAVKVTEDVLRGRKLID